MRRIGRKLLKFIFILCLPIIIVESVFGNGMPVYATTIQEKEEEISRIEDIIANLEDNIDTMTGEQDVLLEQIDDINAEIVNVLAEMELLKGEIAVKGKEIAAKHVEYVFAKEEQNEQEEAMAQRIKLSYESREAKTALTKFIGNFNFSTFLNRTTYAQSVYDYDARMLKEYEETKEMVQQMWLDLEAEKANLEASELALEEQKAYCEELKVELQEKADDYDTLIAEAEQQAKTAEAQLKKERKALAKLQEEEQRKKAQQEAMNKNYETDYNDLIDASAGSDVGKQMAKFGCQYIGNKYVYGGLSLTDGIDCSGFTYRVYENFGYKLPRTSAAQRSVGREVSLENAQPGDLVCYSGHVGLYIGGGYIVHASNSKPYPKGGIKVNKADYRSILTIRRVVE